MKKIFGLFFLGILVFSGFFFVFGGPARAEWANHLVISEIQISGQTANDEFLELYNPNFYPINLQNLPLKMHIRNGNGTDRNRALTFKAGQETIPAHGFYLIAPRNTFFESQADATYSTSDNMLVANGGVYISTSRTPDIEIIDKVGFAAQPEGGYETNPYSTNPGANQSIERKPGGEQGNGEDSNDNSQDFILRENSNPNNSQTPPRPPLSEPPPEEPPPQEPPPQEPPPPQGPICGNNICEAGENYQNCPQDCPRQYNPSDVVINEFVSDPIDGEDEWVELYNNTDEEIDLTNWKIEEGSGAQTDLVGMISSKDFFVAEKIKGYLNNTGDIIILRDPNGRVIDQVVYGDWDDGNKEDNASVTKDPNSVARIIDGQDSDRDNLDFKIATLPTKGEPNKFSEEKEYPFGVMLNELLPNPKGDDSETEFIELKNLTDQEIDLENWKLEDAAGGKFVISSQKLSVTKISAKGFFIIWRKDSKIALNNSGSETIKLYQPNDNLVDKVSYSGTVAEEISYAKDEKNDWFWSTQMTPGEENIINKVNQKPKAVISGPSKAVINEEIIFDASDSYDPDGDQLTYVWDLGDGTKSENILIKHHYSKIGKFNVNLEVKDEADLIDKIKLTIEILSSGTIISFSDLEVEILITEFLPNPEGSDDQEWIEIYNAGDNEVNLSNWFLDDMEGGSKPYKIKEETKILPNQYVIFYRKDTKIALNNNFDSARILDPEGNLFFEVFYEKPKQGFSYALDENSEWYWTSILTPGKQNLFSSETNEVKAKKPSAVGEFLEISLSEVRNQDIGDVVKVQGVVSVVPGVLGVQIFYLAGSGVQIYSYAKDFPDLKIGDWIEVVGELAEYKGETRIKISSKNDITILKNEEKPEPHEVKTGEIDEDLEGSLIVVQGEVIERQTNYFYLDDGSGEIKVYLKATANIKKPKMKDGDWMKIIGIVSQYGEEYRLLPRYQEDIEIIEKPSNEESQNQNNFILGSLIGDNNFSPLNFLSKIISIKYLIVSALFLSVILIGLLIKRKK